MADQAGDGEGLALGAEPSGKARYPADLPDAEILRPDLGHAGRHSRRYARLGEPCFDPIFNDGAAAARGEHKDEGRGKFVHDHGAANAPPAILFERACRRRRRRLLALDQAAKEKAFGAPP